MKIIFSQSAIRQWRRLPKIIQKRIKEKIDFFVSQSNPLRFARTLQDEGIGNYRFRIGDYRIIFDIKDDVIVVLKVGHRKDIYK